MAHKNIAEGSVTTPLGFTAAAVTAGIKQSGRPDLVLVFSDRNCSAAGVFTTNRVAAAPVLLDQETLRSNQTAMRGVVINAGNANACTGEPGLANAREVQRAAAEATGCRPDQFLVMSTGVIGVPLPMARLLMGITTVAPLLARENGRSAAEAIMTTDTRPKHVAIEVDLPGGRVNIGGMAKGAGMIHPDMATLLGLITTDAAISANVLSALLRDAVTQSFNTISIDGDTSTNDTILLFANGASGVPVTDSISQELFGAALVEICRALAMMVIRDGEGVTRVVAIHVTGAPSPQGARQVANTIATSPLVKTAFAGGDPNWGRIMMAVGRSGVEFDQRQLALWIGKAGDEPLQIVNNGTPTDYLEADAAAIFAQPEFTIQVDLGNGPAEALMWTTDLTHEYVSINADYRT